MRRAPSLIVRLVVFLFFAQVVGALITALAIELFVEDEKVVVFKKNRNELAVSRIYQMMIESLRQKPDGSLSIEPSSALAAELARVPTMSIAAFDAKTHIPLPGSSTDLVSQIIEMHRIRTTHMHFVIEGNDREGVAGHLAAVETPYGQVILVIYGYQFEWIDLFYSLKYEIVSYLRFFLLSVMLSILIGWIAFKRSLAPLKKVIRDAERIEMDSLHQRLPMAGVPSEVAPLVHSINSALARLDDGAERQRRFLANAAHELRTPVAILMERLDDSSDVRLMTKLRRDAERIHNIVEQLLATFRINRSAAIDSSLDLVKAVEGIIDDYALLGIKMGRHLVFERCITTCFIKGDPLSINSVLANLVLNALTAEPQGGSVIVRLSADATVEIIDHGSGIEPVDRAMIFEPFWRKDERGNGTGLGLAIARELVTKLGGAISVNETPGGGATFKVTFMLAGEAT